MLTASRVKWHLLFAAVAACFLLSISISLAQASDGEIAAIHSAINSHGAQWVAGETSMTKLSPEARKRRLGTLKPLLTDQEHKAAAQELAALASVTAPASLDWRANNGNFVTPVKDQGNCGSCWAFATTGAAESQNLISPNTPGVDLNLSEQILVSCSRAGNCNGGYIDSASDFIRDMGLPVESCFPYTATNNKCFNACSGWTNGDYHITGWHWVATTAPTADGLESALVTYGPLVTTMNVYSDFFSYTSGIYSHVSGNYQGGHAILIVGYDHAGQYFIVKNSWGTGWGENGYFRIAYTQLINSVQFGAYTIADEGGTPTPPSPSCTYSITPTSKSFSATGGSGTVTVSTQDTCAWTAESNVSWISITAGGSGSGSGTVRYTVASNSTRVQRSGTLTIAGLTFTVTQQRASFRGR
jgi:hypothetical protein